jgi:hypothetical protein
LKEKVTKSSRKKQTLRSFFRASALQQSDIFWQLLGDSILYNFWMCPGLVYSFDQRYSWESAQAGVGLFS